jgi:hypothetical protein
MNNHLVVSTSFTAGHPTSIRRPDMNVTTNSAITSTRNKQLDLHNEQAAC